MSDKVTRLPVRPRNPDDRTLKLVDPFEPGKCNHGVIGNTFYVDESAGTVECGRCHAPVDPIWVLAQLSNEESFWMRSYRANLDTLRKLDTRRRTKCRHCGKMTDIRLA